MIWLDLLALILVLGLLLALLPRPAPPPWPRAALKGLVDPREVDRALLALGRREAELKRSLASPRLLPETQKALEAALARVRQEREEVLALLESLAAERLLAQGKEELELKERLQALRKALAKLQNP